MAARGSMAPAGLLWFCLAPAALLRLHQPQSVQFAKPGETVEMVCETSETIESETELSWYRRGRGERHPIHLLDCGAGGRGGFSCRAGGHRVTLHVASARTGDSGLYLCAFRTPLHWDFGSGTALLVEDSWTAGSWVRVLAPHSDSRGPPSLVCAVGATSGPVLVSWQGGPRRVLGSGGIVEPLVSPVGPARGDRGLCEVQFNSSRPPVRRSVELRRAAGSCMTPGTWVLAVAGVLLLLLSLCLSTRLSTRCPCHPEPTGHQPSTLMSPTSREDEGELTYAQLIFAAR